MWSFSFWWAPTQSTRVPERRVSVPVIFESSESDIVPDRQKTVNVEMNWTGVIIRDSGQDGVPPCKSHNLKENANLMHNGGRD